MSALTLLNCMDVGAHTCADTPKWLLKTGVSVVAQESLQLQTRSSNPLAPIPFHFKTNLPHPPLPSPTPFQQMDSMHADTSATALPGVMPSVPPQATLGQSCAGHQVRKIRTDSRTSPPATVCRALLRIRSPEISKARKGAHEKVWASTKKAGFSEQRSRFWSTVLRDEDQTSSDDIRMSVVFFPVGLSGVDRVNGLVGTQAGDSRTCTRCKFVCSSDAELDRHVNRCSSGPAARSYICEHCGAGFHRRSNLVKHISQVELKLRPFKCDLCGAAFGQKSNLTSHVRVKHNGEKPHACSEQGCDRRFGQQSSLRAHVETVHKRLRRFACECGSTFGHRGDLNRKLFPAMASCYLLRVFILAHGQKMVRILGETLRWTNSDSLKSCVCICSS